MASISSPGVGSGIDIGGLVSQLVAAESQPTALRIEQGEIRTQTEISALGALKGALSAFQDKLASLRERDIYDARKATSSNEDVFTASAGDDAVAGTFDLEVVRLARSHKLASAGVSDASAAFGSGTLTIGMGTSAFTVDIAPGTDSLEAVRDAINAAEDNPGVSATIINVDDGSGGTESKLVLTAGGTGTDNAITVTADDDDGFDADASGLSRLVYDPDGTGTTNMGELQTAIDAQLALGTETITRSGNVISDAIEGVTITLVAQSEPGETTTLAVEKDDAALGSAISSFVTSYNGLVSVFASLASYDQDTGEAGVLLGDAMLRGAERGLRRELAAEAAGLDDAFSTLAAIGITTRDDGTLEIDSTRLDAAVASGSAALETLFAADGTGLVDRLEAVIDPFVQLNGAIDARTDGLESRLDRFADQRAALDRRVTSLEARLLAQFTAMDALVGSLQQTSTYLTQQFDALKGLAPPKSS